MVNNELPVVRTWLPDEKTMLMHMLIDKVGIFLLAYRLLFDYMNLNKEF